MQKKNLIKKRYTLHIVVNIYYYNRGMNKF